MTSKDKVLNGRYELGHILGRGAFSKVYQARNIQTGINVAMKVVSKEKVMSDKKMEQMKREISVMKMINHPNVVKLHEVLATKSRIYLALELVKGHEIYSWATKGHSREANVRNYFYQLISAVDFCHSRGVFHRDLKTENVLVDNEGRVKVTDFGLSALSEHVRHDGLLHTPCGTPAYVAPEVIMKKGYDGAKVDIWSCGVILYVLLAKYFPFQDWNEIVMYKKICRGDFKCPSWFSNESRRLITRMLDPNPETRISIDMIMESAWFKKPVVKCGLSRKERIDVGEEKETETLNAFHIISFSKWFNLSPLFEEKKRMKTDELRFGTMRPASNVISKLEEVGKMNKFIVKKSNSLVRLQGQESGRKGKLEIDANIFVVTPLFLVVEVKKSNGDTMEYNKFCSNELRPALKDIVWTSSTGNSA